MSKKSTYLLGILLTILIGSLLHWYFCCNVCCEKQSCTSDVTSQEVKKDDLEKPNIKEPTHFPFRINDANGDFAFSLEESFNFNESSFSIRDSISGNLNNGILKIKEYLDANGNKRFNITGYYTSNETNNSAFPNLGMARANAVKNHMVSQGISARLINTFGELKEDMQSDKNGVLFGPLYFDIFTRTEASTANDEALKVACEAIKENPLMFYFKTGEFHINLTPEQKQKFAEISRCVDKLGFKISVVGHTDSTGNIDTNMILGQNRANEAKKDLINFGILEENIVTSSKGQTLPIADNATEEGRAKNRRIVVTIN
ncbi:OmpA family protein [uncultured Tenacibaculum sp.]|uniref:OmpA family protein n=1 Tax=uncultured Tenacibaculum sp. TaxID=174713 RepID=UPI00260499D9|nr:OmpA family protein [uncultured Tenacibaculum sp.]